LKSKLLLAFKVLAFFGIGFLILYFVYKNQQVSYLEECTLKGIPSGDCSLFDKVIQDFRSSNLWILMLTVMLFMLSNIFRALRWGLLLEPLGYSPGLANTLGATMIGYLLNLSIPRAGEIAKPASLSKNENIPLDHTIGTIVTDRIIDVVCLLIVFGLTLLLAYDRIFGYLEANLSISEKFSFLMDRPKLSLFLLCLYSFGIWYVYRNWVSVKSNKLIRKILKFGLGIYEGTLSVFKMKSRGLFIFYSIGIWVLYYLMTYLVFFAFEPTLHLSAVAGLVVFLFGSLGIVIPSPGGMGSYHFLVGQALGLYGIDGVDGFSFANIAFFTIQIFGNVFFGVLALVLLPIYNKSSRFS
jgi:uncharacterized protein (TIRG00374 family)